MWDRFYVSKEKPLKSINSEKTRLNQVEDFNSIEINIELAWRHPVLKSQLIELFEKKLNVN